jgi:hypothetical protein
MKKNPFEGMTKVQFINEMSEIRHDMFLEWEKIVLNRSARRERTKSQRLAQSALFDAGFASCANFMASVLFPDNTAGELLEELDLANDQTPNP